jgi:hypothetical protein
VDFLCYIVADALITKKKKLRSLETTQIYPDYQIRPISLNRTIEDEGERGGVSNFQRLGERVCFACYVSFMNCLCALGMELVRMEI